MWYIFVDDQDQDGYEAGVKALHTRLGMIRPGEHYRRMTTRIVNAYSVPWQATGIVVKPESVEHIAMAESRGVEVLVLEETAPRRGPGRPPKIAEPELPMEAEGAAD